MTNAPPDRGDKWGQTPISSVSEPGQISIDDWLRKLGSDPNFPRMEARVLLCHATELTREQLIAQGMRLLDQATRNRLDALLERRRAGEPLAYIVGEREFFGRAFRVTPDVLIPRPETELLCELALARLAVSHGERSARVLDLGTGSGIVGVTIACERPQDDVCATDLSEAALEVARSNARTLGARIRMVRGSWYEPLSGERFDCIVSNPPYITPGDPHLGQGDLRFEPSLALRDPVDGLSSLRSIVEGAPGHLHAGGWLLLEHGWDQANAVRSLLADAGFGAIASHPDLAGIDRVAVARLGNG